MEENFLISDDLLQARAADKHQVQLFCFPRSERGIIDYEGYTGKDIDRFVDHAAKYYMHCGLQPVRHRTSALETAMKLTGHTRKRAAKASLKLLPFWLLQILPT